MALSDKRKKKREKMQLAFLAKLDQRIQAIRDLAQTLKTDPDASPGCAELHILVHNLHGAAGTYGLMSLAHAAQSLEAQLADFQHTTPTEQQWTSIDTAIERLSDLVAIVKKSGGDILRAPTYPTRNNSVPLIHIVEDDPEQARQLEERLREEGFRTERFSSPRAFRDRPKDDADEPPAAVVMDLIFPDNKDGGTELIAELGVTSESRLPVIVASVRDDLEARLEAFRAGACRYLSKPYDMSALIDILDAVTGRQPSEKFRVLMVDDDEIMLEAETGVLTSAGMDVRSLSNPLQVLDVLNDFVPDVIVLDVYMPHASGPELAAVIRERDALLQTPILFLSSEKDLSRQLRALSLGGDDFLVKPIDPEHFVSAVSSRARRARQNRAIQRRLEISLYEREREHRALDHHAIVSVTNAKGEIIRVNDQFCAISGYRPEELLGQNHHVVKSDEHPPEFYRDLWRTIARGEVWQGDICNRRKDGKLYWVASTITPFLDERGKPYQYVSIRTDITHVKAAEALQRAQNAMRGVVGKAAAGLLAADAETMDAAIEQALRQAGEHLGVDRAYLFLLNDNATRMSNSHEWSAPGIAPQKDILQDIPVESAPWWWAQILGNQPVIVSDVAALPSEAAAEKTMFQSLDIRALCGFPIRRGDVTQGFIGFDQVSMARDWDAPALDLLRLLAGQMGSALLRAASEREVQRQHRFTQDVLDSVSANIAVLNRDGIIVAVNEPWRRFAIQNAEQAGAPVPNTDIGTNYLAVCRQPAASDSHDVEDVATTGINAVMSGQVPSFRHEYPCPSPDKPRWFEMTVMPLSGGGGVVISHVNITERKLAEQAADSARERLRRGQIYANIGTWEWNIVTGDLFWTERIAPLFGYPEGDLETSYDNFLAAVHPDDRQAVTGAVSACIEYDKPYDIEHRVIWPDGTERWLLERGAVVRDAEGKPLQMIGVVQDIDDRKRAEMVLAEREHQLVEAQALASLGNWSADLVTGDLIWSDEIYRIFGYEPGSFVPSVEAFHSFVHPDDLDKVHASEKQATETGHHDVVHRIIRKDGSVRHVHELAQAETDDNGKLVRLTGTVQDITSEVQIRESLIAATEEAERANKAKSDFLSSMSHELRTPMNAIIGFSQLLDYDDELRADQKENVSEILKAGEHLLELINEVLDLAKVESGKIDLSLEAVEVCPVVEECVTLISTLADQKQINITHRGLAGILVRADRTRLKQALLNLLSNAIKYNREAGTVRIEIQSTDKDYLRIAITDTGWGIARNKLEQLFQPFSRLDAENSNIEGTGIGLALTRRLVEMMGGRVDVQSKEGVGSTFCIELPVVTLPGDTFNPVNDDTNNEIANPASTDQPENQNTILYIEDNPANLKLVSRLLRRRKHVDLLTAHTPDLGIELAMARQPELILLDINLPGMDGYEVLNVLQSESRTRNIPVIAITANAMPRDIEYGKQAGFAYYLTKPLDIVQFNNALDHILADAAEGQDKK